MAFTPFVESDQPTMAAFNEKFRELITEAVGQAHEIVLGSYVGTGLYGEQNPCSLAFARVPFLVAVVASSNGLVYGNYSDKHWAWIISPYALTVEYQHKLGLGQNNYTAEGNNPAGKTTEDKKTIMWYSSKSGAEQMNATGVTYYYFALLENQGESI